MSMQFKDPMNEKTREFIEEAFGPGVPMDERTALVTFRDNLVDREQNRKLANIAQQPLTVALHEDGEIKQLSDGSRYQVTPQGWRKLDPMTFEDMHQKIIRAKANGFDEAVFVGLSEIDTIRRRAKLDGYPKLKPGVNESLRFQINGLDVYVVDANSYFRVA